MRIAIFIVLVLDKLTYFCYYIPETQKQKNHQQSKLYFHKKKDNRDMAETAPHPPTTGIGAMEAAADAALAARAWDHAIEMNQASIEDRNNSPEVALLNDAAELHIYGSRGRTYTDPETGAVIADAAHPMLGRIEEIRQNRRYGTTEAERNAVADGYESDVNALLGEGFELTQAAFIMDLSEQDLAAKNQLVANFLTQGLSPTEANDKAERLYALKDQKRKKIIKEVGLNTREEYDGYLEAVNRGPRGAGTGEGEDVPPPPSSPEIAAREAVIEILNAELTRATDRYALETARSRNSYLGRFARGDSRVGGLMKRIPGVQRALNGINNRLDQDVVTARAEYERLYNEVGARTSEVFQLRGMPIDEVALRAVHGASYRDVMFEESVIHHRHSLSREGNPFTDWWVRNDGTKGKIKKALLVAAVTGTVGAATVLAAPLVGLGAVLAPTLTGGATGAGIAGHVNRRRANSFVGNPHTGGHVTLARSQSNEDRMQRNAANNERFARHEWHQVGHQTESVERRTDQEMVGNRKRVRQAAAIGKAAGGGAGLLTAYATGDFTFGDLNPFSKDSDNAASSQNRVSGRPAKTETMPKPTGSTETPIRGRIFETNTGNGITQEMNDFAELNGFEELQPEQVKDLFDRGSELFGKDNLINTETYTMPNGDPGILNPGWDNWNPDFMKFMYDEMANMQSNN